MSNAMNNIDGPERRALTAIWQNAMGIQAADGLSVSDYLRQTAQKHIDGIMSFDELSGLINRYYLEKNAQDASDPEKEEADKVSVNIARLLLSDTMLDLSPEGLSTLHRAVFDGVYENTGVLRDYEEYKREWVLGGDAISCTKLEALPRELEECLAKEKKYDYDSVTSDALISHLTSFVASIWRMCPFGDGNTRFTATLTLLYLHDIGINIKNDTFSNYSWYFHNALARANYRDLVKNIEEEPVYLERFFRNMLLGEQWELRNRYVHVRPAAEWRVQPKGNSNPSTGQVQIKKETRKGKERDKENTSKEVVEEANNPNILFLTVAIGEDFLSVKEIMARLHLKGRDNFLKLYLSPAIQRGLVAPLYPNAPRHPRQKYLLSQKGLDFLTETGQEMVARIRRHLTGAAV